MKSVFLLIISIIPLYSQWEAGIGYSISKQTFENIDEWRVYEGEIQIHIDGISYFYNENNLDLFDEVKVQMDTLKESPSKYKLFDNKFDKVIYNIAGNRLKIYDEKTSDIIFNDNLNNYVTSKYYKGRESHYIYDNYLTFKSDNKLYILNNNYSAEIILTKELFPHNLNKFLLFIYDLEKDTFEIKHFYELGKLITFDFIQFDFINHSPPIFYFKSEEGSYDWYSDYSILSKKVYKFDTKNDDLVNLDVNKDIIDKINNLNFSGESNYHFTNYIFKINNLYNWNIEKNDSTLIPYKPILIQEIKPNIFLMESDSIGYFTYNLITQNISIIKKLNDYNQIYEFKNPKLNLKNNNFYAETNHNKIIRISLASFIENLISLDFSVDKNMADSNYVFNFTNKIDGEVDSYLWDFGDGMTSTEKNPKHKYDFSGKYDVKLTYFKNGNEISNIKKEYVYIPTPVKLNISHTMTINENDATIYVTNGATGSSLKHTLVYTNYPFFSDVPDIMIDTISAGSYSFKTNKSFFTKSLEFSVSNELYSASKRIYFRDYEFDYWTNYILDEVNLRTINYTKYLKTLGKTFLIHNENHLPIIVNELGEQGIIIDNLQGIDEEIIINKKIIHYNNQSFITDDNYLYKFRLENGINYLDSVLLTNIIGKLPFLFIDNLDESNYVFANYDYLHIIDSQGNHLNSFENPKNEILIFKKYKDKYYLGIHYGNKRFDNINIYDSDFNLLNYHRISKSLTLSGKVKTNLTHSNDTLKIIRTNQNTSNFYEIDLNTENIIFNSNSHNHFLSSKMINNKLISIEYIPNDEAIGSGWYYNSNVVIYDNNYIELFDLTLNERPGPILASTFVNDNFYIYGLIRKSDGFKKTFFKLDLNDELTLSLKSKLHNKFSIYPNPAKNKLNVVTDGIISNIKIIDLLGRVVYQSNTNSKEIDISNLETGIYNLIVNQEHSMKFIKE